MGACNKLTLPVDGRPLLRRTAEVLLQAWLREVVVVLGHEHTVARSILRGLPLRLTYNPHYREGQMTSVHCGMAALTQRCDAVLVCLADLPLLEVGDISTLITAYAKCSTSVLVPTYRGQRGNPIVLNYAHRQQILNGDRNLGCKRLITQNPGLVTAQEMSNDHVVFDVDTPDAYHRLRQRLNGGGQVMPAFNPS